MSSPVPQTNVSRRIYTVYIYSAESCLVMLLQDYFDSNCIKGRKTPPPFPFMLALRRAVRAGRKPRRAREFTAGSSRS